MDLEGITMTSGVNEKGKPFITVVATSTDKQLMIGQLDPDEARHHSLNMLTCAEGAEQDAAALRVVREVGMPDEMAAAIVIELRKLRGV